MNIKRNIIKFMCFIFPNILHDVGFAFSIVWENPKPSKFFYLKL
jgi:hypothetical protein